MNISFYNFEDKIYNFTGELMNASYDKKDFKNVNYLSSVLKILICYPFITQDTTLEEAIRYDEEYEKILVIILVKNWL